MHNIKFSQPNIKFVRNYQKTMNSDFPYNVADRFSNKQTIKDKRHYTAIQIAFNEMNVLF